MSVETGMQLVTSTGTTVFKHNEHVEWDIPYETEGGDFPDLSNLSLGTEMRNKMWESDNKLMLCGNIVSHQSQSSPALLSHLDHNQNPSCSESSTNQHFMNGLDLNILSKPVMQSIGVTSGSYVSLSGKFVEGNSQSMEGTGITSPTLQQSPKAQPLLPLLTEHKNHHLQENGVSSLKKMFLYNKSFLIYSFLFFSVR